jgi:hypothetical protein
MNFFDRGIPPPPDPPLEFQPHPHGHRRLTALLKADPSNKRAKIVAVGTEARSSLSSYDRVPTAR